LVVLKICASRVRLAVAAPTDVAVPRREVLDAAHRCEPAADLQQSFAPALLAGESAAGGNEQVGRLSRPSTTTESRKGEGARRNAEIGLPRRVVRRSEAGEPGGKTLAQLAPGQKLGQYLLSGVLADSRSATVYCARDTRQDREVVLKVLKTQSPSSVEGHKLQAGLCHPHVCPVYDIMQHEGTWIAVLPLIQGESLAGCGWFASPRRSAELVRELARTLEAIHAAGMVHGDVCDRHILLDMAWEPYLTGFEAARRVGAPVEETGKTVAGERESAAQEASRLPDYATDVHGLGNVLWELLFGFRGVSWQALPDRAVRQMPLPARLKAICRQAMAEHPAQRFRSAGEMAEALDEYLRESDEALRASIRPQDKSDDGLFRAVLAAQSEEEFSAAMDEYFRRRRLAAWTPRRAAWLASLLDDVLPASTLGEA
jgi:serine/threonine-protein kinase